MPRTRSLAWAELRIGVLTIVAIVIASVLVFSLTGSRGFFWQQYRLKVKFTNVAGLAAGSPVRLAGVEVGQVETVALSGVDVDVLFRVNVRYSPHITTASVARLGSISLLGESAVDITPATSGTPIPQYGYVPPGKAATALADITDQAGEGIEELTSLIKDMRDGKGTVGRLMTDEQLYADLQRFVSSAGALTDGLREGRGTLGQLLNDPKAAESLQASLSNIEELTRQINSGEGSLGRLLKDDSFAKTLTSATTNLDGVVARLNRGEGTMGKLLNDDTLITQLNSVTARLDELTRNLNEGQGTMGQLLKEKQLYENINGAVGDLRTLLAHIEKDPRKYLNIKVSIF